LLLATADPFVNEIKTMNSEFRSQHILHVLLVVAAVSCCSSVEAANLQMHSPVDVDQVPYIFTLGFPKNDPWVALPVGGGKVDLKECVWANVPMPWYATDAHALISGVTNKKCDVSLAAFVPDGVGGVNMQYIDHFLSAAGSYQVIAPFLGNDNIDLFIGIDLAKYHTSGGSTYAFGDTFSFVNGTNDLLPGFVVGTSAIYLDGIVGWKTDNPFTGSATVIAEGGVCPEPSSFVLALTILFPIGITSLIRNSRQQ
jgi:hypothetical protein